MTLLADSAACPVPWFGPEPVFVLNDEEDNLGGNGNLSLLQIDLTSSRPGADFPKWTQAFALTQDACLPGLVVYLTRHCSQLSISTGKT